MSNQIGGIEVWQILAALVVILGALLPIVMAGVRMTRFFTTVENKTVELTGQFKGLRHDITRMAESAERSEEATNRILTDHEQRITRSETWIEDQRRRGR